MISRQTAKTLGELYEEVFSSSKFMRSSINQSKIRTFFLKKEMLYDFIYTNDYEAYFLNAVASLPSSGKRQLKEFIMKLHTGETLTKLTTDWTWEARQELGQKLLFNLAEDILITYTDEENIGEESTLTDLLLHYLELDGYMFKGGKLYFSEAAVLDVEEEQGLLAKLISDCELTKQDVMNNHLTLSSTHYADGHWGDCISNARCFLECVAQEVAGKHHLLKHGSAITNQVYSKPFEVRLYLEREHLLEQKEKMALGETYGLLSNTGSHPYMAEKDQARLMRYLALAYAQFILYRMLGFIKSQKGIQSALQT